MVDLHDRIRDAMADAGLSQRAMAGRTGISQATLSRIASGSRPVKMPELIRIAEATGCPVSRLTGQGVDPRVQCAARSTNGAGMDALYGALLGFLELDAHLDDQAVPAAPSAQGA